MSCRRCWLNASECRHSTITAGFSVMRLKWKTAALVLA
nr:hypothetical protein [Escherichia coli]